MQAGTGGPADELTFPAFLHQMRRLMRLRQEPDLSVDIRLAEAMISAMSSVEQNIVESLREEASRISIAQRAGVEFSEVTRLADRFYFTRRLHGL